MFRGETCVINSSELQLRGLTGNNRAGLRHTAPTGIAIYISGGRLAALDQLPGRAKSRKSHFPNISSSQGPLEGLLGYEGKTDCRRPLVHTDAFYRPKVHARRCLMPLLPNQEYYVTFALDKPRTARPPMIFWVV